LHRVGSLYILTYDARKIKHKINSTLSTQEFSFGVVAISHNNVIISTCGTTGHTEAVLYMWFTCHSPERYDQFFFILIFSFNMLYRASCIILYNDQQMHNYFTNYHIATCFDTIVILRELVINNLPSYTSISNAAVGNTIYN
jgi:hypothetical protein